MGNFNQTHLRIITRETVFQKALRTVSSISQSTVLETKGSSSNDTMTVYTIHSCRCKASASSQPLTRFRKGVIS